MAKKSLIARDLKRIELEKKYRTKYQELKKQAQEKIKVGSIPWEEFQAIQKLPRNSNRTRIQRRCRQCGRPHAVYRKFGLCRLCLRKFAMKGMVPGLVKASW